MSRVKPFRPDSIQRDMLLSQAGFTLIEIFVALSIFSLAALAMVNLQGYSVQTTARLSDRALAWQTAQNIAVEQMTSPIAPTLGTQQGDTENGGTVWRWTVQSRRISDDRLVQMTISVRGTGARAQSSAQLMVVRLAELGLEAAPDAGLDNAGNGDTP